MRFDDLRDWIKESEELGELKRVEHADWDVEIGTIVDLYQEKMGLPALLFDKIKGYPPGYRILANSLTSIKRIALTLGLPPEATALDIVKLWLDYLRNFNLVPPRVVEKGPILENVQEKDDINLLAFPAPKWHELDGGRYLGTGCVVIMKDPDSDWVNLGVYRVQVFDESTLSVMISKGKQGSIIMQKYWDSGQPCPVAISFGHDVLLYLVGGMEIPYGVCEYDVCGGLRGEPVEVIKGTKTNLPIPATGEIVIEGEIHPDQFVESEGPFGEWTGYYAGGRKPQPKINVKAVLHRDNPIILGAMPRVPPNDDTYYRGFLRSAAVWDELEKAGVPGIQGVWAHEAGGGRFMLTVSIKQLYPGHAKQAGLIASQCHSGGYANRITLVVDDDIDPANTNEVIWVLCTRTDPREDVEILKRCWSTRLDPMSYPEEARVLNSRMVIDACRPWERLDTFSPVVRPSTELKDKVIEKWRDLFPAG
ncbi:MAG: UbiD family decarboxylase [Deltaproteobacteria bacterium]|nr:MAG: UbiD family decarboxylase [Deltaproteobacteria bacterium]